MAIYRQVHLSFWQDGFVLTLPPDEKYFYLYLMTNSKTTQCGIYELPLRVIELETGFDAQKVFELIHKFVGYRKIMYNEETREIMLLNWIKHNMSNSPKVKTRVKKELSDVKHIPYVKEFYRLCIKYGYSIDTQTQKEEEQNKDYIVSDTLSDRIRLIVNECEIKNCGVDGLDTICSFAKQVDVEVIEAALRKSKGKPLNYFLSVINGFIEEGKTTKESMNPFRVVNAQKQVDIELEQRRIEIARNKWIENGGDPNEFRYEHGA
ncbi:hypothetical protein [Paenibacillus sp. GYB003]|uniref:hypothetical protein n=1 Tax=Paenibacillus sp. GYB003 TaxID=2994392 RepID=UPI002F965B88